MELDESSAGVAPGLSVNSQAQGPSRSLQHWSEFVTRCITERLEPERLEAYLSIQNARYPLPAVAIADVFLRPTPSNHENLDPRIPRYIQVLSRARLIDTPSVLAALYKYSSSHVQIQAAGHPALDTANVRWGNSYAAEEVFFYRLTKAISVGFGIKNASEAIGVCIVMARWIVLFTAASTAFAQDAMGQIHNAQQRDEMESARAAFVMLLLSVSENQMVLDALGRPAAAEARRGLSESLTHFIPSILQNSTPPIAERLEQFRTGTLASPKANEKKTEVLATDMGDLLDSAMAIDNVVIPELLITNSRAGLYIYLNASLVGRPLIDDAVLFSYLHNRYQGDMQSTTIDLILASFDVLANAVFRNEGQKTGHLLRSYLINKVPLLLATLSQSMFPPLTAQYCITEALSQVDTNAFPTLSAMFDVSSNNNTFTDSVRQDFCFACCLHGLIPESSIEGLLGEITYQSLPQGGRYAKEPLVEECMADSEKIQRLVGELDNMDGNVGAVCQALTEVIARLCSSKETMTLKLLCSQLVKKPLSLDVMLLFDKPHTILHPLCELLDNWRYEEDQGEYQPVYEEFGSILLLLLAFVYRYNLSAADLGIQAADSFVAKLISRGHSSRPMGELTEQEKAHLDGWIRGLFDNESGGLGDELMSSCPPQDFYMLVPTLFEQTILAFGHGYLDEESLKTGIEYLVDTFLAPCLVPAILYMSNQLWLNRKEDIQAIIRILQLILMTKQGSNEAQTMLSAVVNIIAKPLEHALRLYQRQDPKNQEIEPLVKAFKDNIPLSRRTAGAGHNELESWTAAPGGGLAASVRSTFQGFVQWSLHPGINIMPTSYTHRQLLAALKMLGARRVLQLLVEEVKNQTDAGSGSIAHDVATALVCAPNVTSVPAPFETDMIVDPNHQPAPRQRRLSLREVLKMEAEDFQTIQKTDPATAEILLRLHRKVEAQLVMPQPAQTILQGELDLGLDTNAASSLNDALVAAQNDTFGSNDGNVNLDLGGAGTEMDFRGGSGDGTGGLDLGGDDDIFSGLGSMGGGNDNLLEGWEMDLT